MVETTGYWLSGWVVLCCGGATQLGGRPDIAFLHQTRRDLGFNL